MDAARAIVAASLRHRIATGGTRPPLESLDHAFIGRRAARAADFGQDVIPPASFAILVVLALDVERAQAWERMHLADRIQQAALATLWAREVWPRFVARYGLG